MAKQAGPTKRIKLSMPSKDKNIAVAESEQAKKSMLQSLRGVFSSKQDSV